MNFVESVTTCFRKSFTFSGRASRSEYWWFTLFSFIFQFVSSFIIMSMSLSEEATSSISFLITLLIFPASISVTVRRLHDVNRSGWWYWIAFTIIGLIPFFYWSIKRGTDGKNNYGNSPI